MAFVGAVMLAAATYLGRFEVGLLIVIVLMLSSFMFFGVPLSREVVEILLRIEENTRAPARPSASDPEREIRTSGGGAFIGMVLGGFLGLPLGPLGVLAGGILGALVGDRIEYESLKAERRRARERR